jgi:hypothetical protein
MARLTQLLCIALLAGAACGQYYINASPMANGLEKDYRTRGFGDSNEVDVWVPFSFGLSGASGVQKATITIVVKPIGQLIGTDDLLIRGASGQVHAVYDGFCNLTADTWSQVTIDLSGNGDIMQAIRAGRLDCVIQDDSAVHSAQLCVNTVQRQKKAVYLYDVYYWGYDASTGQSSWFRYGTCFSAGDAERVRQWFADNGYQATVGQPRFWRWVYE